MTAPSAAATTAPAPEALLPLQGVLASLSKFEPPFEIDRFGTSFGLHPVRPSGVLEFRFCFKEVPFEARTERRDGRPVLTLRGDLGILPFTIENAARRRRLRTVLAAVRQGSGMRWSVGRDHHIRVTGEIALDLPLTPTAVIAGATALLLRSRLYLELIVSVAGEG
jgi:hypothetical protein